jgi:hypothetical protein
MAQTAEQLWDAVQRVGLLTPADAAAVRSSWFEKQRKEASDP